MRKFLVIPLLLLVGLVMGLTACSDDSEALTLEEYFAKMDRIDKDTSALFDKAFEQDQAGAVYDGIKKAVALARDESDKVDPPSEVKDAHNKLVAAIKDFDKTLGNAGSGLDRNADSSAVEAIFPDDTAVQEAFCAVQAIADEKGIEAEVGCEEGEDPSALPAEATDKVLIQDFAFQPAHIQVRVGAKVTWTDGNDTAPHTATSDTGVFDSGQLKKGETFVFTFTKVGEFPYFCEIHPDMLGLVTVTP